MTSNCYSHSIIIIWNYTFLDLTLACSYYVPLFTGNIIITPFRVSLTNRNLVTKGLGVKCDSIYQDPVL